MPSKGMSPNLPKRIFASSKRVFPGAIPQKQGTAQFIGSFIRCAIVSVAWAGSNVSSGTRVMVGEGLFDGNLPILVGVDGIVSVVTGVRIVVLPIVGAIADCVGWIVWLIDVHPANAITRVKKRCNNDNGFGSNRACLHGNALRFFAILGCNSLWISAVYYIRRGIISI